MNSQVPPLNGQAVLVPPPPHRRGKIARLPKSARDQINQMLRDGASYQRILATLHANPELSSLQISEHSLSRWKQGGYQDWLARQEWREDAREIQTESLELLDDSRNSRFHEVSLQVAAMRIFELLQRLEASCLSPNLQDLPPAFLRLLAVLPRISREALRYQKYRDACLQARQQIQALQNPNRKLNDEERRAIVDKVDQILGIAAPHSDFTDPDPER